MKLREQKIQKAFPVGLGNLYALKFYHALSSSEVRKLRSVAVDVAGTAVKKLTDYDECKDGKQSCYNGLRCVNTEFSFKCGCPEGYEVKDNRCIIGKLIVVLIG